MRSASIVGVLALLVAGVVPAAAQAPAAPLSLADAVHRATTGTPLVQLAEARSDESRAQLIEARGALFPTLSVGGNWLNRSFNLKAFGFSLPTAPGQTPLPDLVGPFSSVDGRISGSLSLFDYSNLLRVRAAKAGVSGSEMSGDAASEAAAAAVGQAYVRAVRAQAVVEARQQDVQLAQDLVGLAQTQVDAGVSTGLDLTRARTQLAQARGLLLVAQNESERAGIELARAMGLDPATRFTLTDTLTVTLATSSAPTDRDAALAEARERRPDLKAEAARVTQASLARSAVKAERLPRVGLAADWGYSGLRIPDAIATRDISLQVTVPLFDGFRRSGRIDAADAAEREANIRQRDLEQQVSADVDGALLDIRSAAQEESVAQERLALAQEEVSQARDRFQTGVAGNIELITAQSSLVRARDAVIDARTQAAQARIRLARAVGAAGTLR